MLVYVYFVLLLLIHWIEISTYHSLSSLIEADICTPHRIS